jgi:hypothetical protein
MRPKSAGVMAGAAVLAVAGAALAAAVAGALIADEPAARAAAAPAPGAVPHPVQDVPRPGDTQAAPDVVSGAQVDAQAAARSVSDDVLRMAVEKAPFDPERRVTDPYLLPEERPQPRPARVEREAPPPAPAFRVLGTVAAGRGGVAVIEVPGEPPRVVALGEEILGYRVSSIQEGRVVLGGDGGRSISVAVPDVAPRAAADVRVTRDTQNGNQRGGGGGGGRGGAAGAAAADLVNQAMRRLREETGGDVRMEMRGDRVILTAPDGTRREIQIGGDGTFEMDVITGPQPGSGRAAPAAPARPRRPGGGE